MNPERAKNAIGASGIGAVAVAFSMWLLRDLQQAWIGIAATLVFVLLFLEPFVGLTFYIAAVYIRPQDFFASIAGTRLILVLGGVALANMMLRLSIDGRRMLVFGAPQDYFLMWILVAMVASNMVHLNFENAVLSGYGFLNIIVIYLLITNLVDTEKRIDIFFNTLVVLSLFLVVHGVLQHHLGEGFGGQIAKKGRIRGYGIISDPNVFAMTIMIVIPYLLYKIREHRNPIVKGTAVGAVVAILYAIYLTNSRGGVLSLALMLGAMAVYHLGMVRGVGIGAIVLVLFLWFGPSRMSMVSIEEASAFSRILSWKAGYEMFASNPVFGIGADMWPVVKPQVLEAHNSFVHVAAEWGLFGLIPWVLILTTSIRNVFFALRHNTGRTAKLTRQTGALFFALIGYVTASLFQSRQDYFVMYILAALAVVVVRVFVNQSGSEFRLFTKHEFYHGLVIMVVGLVGFKLFVVFATSR